MSLNDDVLLRLIEQHEGQPTVGPQTLARPVGEGVKGWNFTRLDVKSWFRAHGFELSQDEWEKDRWFVRCPWEEEHSEGQERLTDTMVREGSTEKWPVPFLHCSHSHSGCQRARHGKHDLQALAAEWGDAEAFGATKRADGGYPLTDMGNAERLVDGFGEKIRYNFDRGHWLIWTGARWEVDSTDRMVGLAKETTRLLLIELTKLPEEDRKKLHQHFLKSESERAIQGMVRLARSLVPIQSESLDQDAWLLNFTNGTLDLRTGELAAHRRDDYLTRLLPFDYDPRAACPHWERFIRTVTRNEELALYLQKAVGYSLSGSTREKCLFMVEGPTDSGKTTFLETIGNVLLRAGYATQVPAEMLLAKREGGIPNDLAKCAGMRFIWTSETDDNRRLATGLIKAITGRDRISARFMRQEWFDFTSTFKLWFATNHPPTIRESGNAIWNRIRYIPFAFTLRGDEQDRDLPDKLKRELAGILAWAVAGCRLWLAEGMTAPGVMQTALSDYRREMDLVLQWVEERCVREEGAEAPCLPLYQAYATWCKGMNELPLSKNRFTPALKQGFEQVERRNRSFFKGLRLMTALEAQGIGPQG